MEITGDRRKKRNQLNRQKKFFRKFEQEVKKRARELLENGFGEQLDKEIENCNDLATYASEAFDFSKEEVEKLGGSISDFSL